MAERVPLSVPSLDGNEARYLQECVTQNWVSGGGPFVRRFEEMFAERAGVAGAVAVTTGTTALHLALVTLGIGPGDEVVVPALSFVATVNPVRYVGATPVFADVEPDTFTIDPAHVEALLTARTRAVIPVHLYGHPARMTPLLDLTRRHGIAVVEDATEALGSFYRDQPCGTVGDVGAFSFNGNKVITTGGGGMLVAADPQRLEHLRHLSLQARVEGSREYLHDEVGFNAALSNLQAAVGVAQLERLDLLLQRRRQIAERYAEALAGADDLMFSAEAPWATTNSWLMTVLVDSRVSGRDRHSLAATLADAGIDTRPFFYPLPDLVPYRDVADGDWPIARDLHARGLCIPSSAGLAASDQERVIDALLAR